MSGSQPTASGSRFAEQVADRFVPGAAVASTTPVQHGNRTETVFVRFADRSSIVVQVTDDPTQAATEAALLSAIEARTYVPVPTVVGHEQLQDHGVLVTEYVDGTNLHEAFVDLPAHRQRSIVTEFGRSLAELHDAFTFDGCGPVTTVDGAFVAAGDESEEWRQAYGEAAIDRLPEDFADLVEPLRERLATSPAPAGTPTLFPWDFRPGNALVRDGELAAVLDWEAPLAAPTAVSVAKARYLVADWYVDDSAPLRRAFREGYEQVRPFPTISAADRITAIADTAVDSRGVVTNPRYPELDREASIEVHRGALQAALDAR